MMGIKLRAWDKEWGKMYMVYSWSRDSVHYWERNDGTWDCECPSHVLELRPMEKVELMIFLGLKDKNGKEIYRCDILKEETGGMSTPGTGHKWVPTYTIGWIDWAGPFCGYYRYKDINKLFNWVNPINESKTEIIGTIFETPELLNE